jgi:hypothetical protein
MDWNLTGTQKEQFLELLNSLGSHSVYPTAYIHRKLIECGIPTTFNEISGDLLVGSVLLKSTIPEFGDAGISPFRILQAAIDAYGLNNAVISHSTGRGFHFRDCLTKLANQWGIKKSYL